MYQIDAFAGRPFQGNPAAVCLMTEPRDEAWMQALAAENNLSETAYVGRRTDGFDLRWFTPALEVALCGHATLAAALALRDAGWIGAAETARFHTKSGLLTAQSAGDWITLDFRSDPPEETEPADGLLTALGVRPAFVGRGRFDTLVRVDSERDVRAADPDFRLLAKLPVRGVILTAKAEDDRFDFVSRFFAPGAGVDEDPVTGSAHCCLAPYWSLELGRDDLTGYQASSRGGVVRTVWAGDRVQLSGQAVIVFRGTLCC
jgi:PhzF family phenazine biosynthesis protein